MTPKAKSDGKVTDSHTRWPHARIKAMNKLMESVKDGWKPGRVDIALIETLAIAPSKEAQALQAIRFLDMIDDDGVPTEKWDEIKRAYQPTMRGLAESKYAPLFERIPNKLITQESVVNFFIKSGYGRDTAEYQGMFFGWLCRQAGIQVPNLPETFKRARFGSKPRTKTSRPT